MRPKRFVLVADELSATTLAELPQDRLAGVVVRDGAANSHAAIMVRARVSPPLWGPIFSPRCCTDARWWWMAIAVSSGRS